MRLLFVDDWLNEFQLKEYERNCGAALWRSTRLTAAKASSLQLRIAKSAQPTITNAAFRSCSARMSCGCSQVEITITGLDYYLVVITYLFPILRPYLRLILPERFTIHYYYYYTTY